MGRGLVKVGSKALPYVARAAKHALPLVAEVVADKVMGGGGQDDDDDDEDEEEESPQATEAAAVPQAR